jgi:predicted hydrocarbon binding protein
MLNPTPSPFPDRKGRRETLLPETPDRQHYFYPNRMGRVILLAMDEILGRSGVNAVLHLAGLPGYINEYPPYNQDMRFPFEHISRLQVALENEFGPRAGRGLALRVGRACLKYGLLEFGPELGLTDLAFRMLPLQAKLIAGSEAFAALFNKFTDQRVNLRKDAQTITWQIERCPVCWERQSETPCCHLAVGLLQEALFWISAGRIFEAEEKTCVACGDSACTIVINRTPMS